MFTLPVLRGPYPNTTRLSPADSRNVTETLCHSVHSLVLGTRSRAVPVSSPLTGSRETTSKTDGEPVAFATWHSRPYMPSDAALMASVTLLPGVSRPVT